MKVMLTFIFFISLQKELWATDTTDIAIIAPAYNFGVSMFQYDPHKERFPVVLSFADGKSAWLGRNPITVDDMHFIRYYNDSLLNVKWSSNFRILTKTPISLRIQICDLKGTRKINKWEQYIVKDTTITIEPVAGYRRIVYVISRSERNNTIQINFMTITNPDSFWFEVFKENATGRFNYFSGKTEVFPSNVPRRLQNDKRFISDKF